AVAKAEEACFLTVEIGLDDNLGASRTESTLEAIVDGGERLVNGHGNGHALAGGKAIGLDDDRGALLADISLRLRRVVEALVGAGRNVVAGADVLGEALRALELGCCCRRAEDGKA